MNMPKTSRPKISDKIIDDFSAHGITFQPAEVFYWSPQEKIVHFVPSQLEKEQGVYQLLHEVGHAICEHTNYRSSISLLKMEVEAWEKAKEISAQYATTIPDEHIEKCLDSYRDWLHQRSTCPACSNIATEHSENQFQCFNCLQKWSVPSGQQTRSYRLRG